MFILTETARLNTRLPRLTLSSIQRLMARYMRRTATGSLNSLST